MPATPAPTLNNVDRVCELFAALKKAPRSRRDMQEMSGLSDAAVRTWLRALQAAGLVEPAGVRKTEGMAGRTPEVWELLPYPFMRREPAFEGPSRRVYVAGPMSGFPDLNFPAFHEAARRLRRLGLEVINPAELNGDMQGDWAACLKADVRELVTCDTVALLPRWERSRGAQVEHRLARDLGLRVIEVELLVAECRVRR